MKNKVPFELSGADNRWSSEWKVNLTTEKGISAFSKFKRKEHDGVFWRNKCIKKLLFSVIFFKLCVP